MESALTPAPPFPRRRIVIKGLLILGITAFFIHWHLGHRPIAKHNQYLDAAIKSAVRIDLSIVNPEVYVNGQLIENTKKFSINNRSEISSLLPLFRLPFHMRASGKFHECAGHLKLTIIMPDGVSFKMRYDHGKGIYPIAPAGHPGFAYLDQDTCKSLTKYFISLGFTNKDLGISH